MLDNLAILCLGGIVAFGLLFIIGAIAEYLDWE
jgi:hypothetical protein